MRRQDKFKEAKALVEIMNESGIVDALFPKNKAAVELGKLGGSVKSKAKTIAVRENGKKGGRPRKCDHEWVDHWDAKLPEYICSKCSETKPK